MITVKELLELFVLPISTRINLKDWEKEMLIERAKEYNMPKDEMEKLLKGFKDKIFYVDENTYIYNLLDSSKYTMSELIAKHNVVRKTIDRKIENKRCIDGIPYSYDKNELPLTYVVNNGTVYECIETGERKPNKCWCKYFNTDSLNISAYCITGMKYLGKYTFKKVDIKLLEVL